MLHHDENPEEGDQELRSKQHRRTRLRHTAHLLQRPACNRRRALGCNLNQPPGGCVASCSHNGGESNGASQEDQGAPDGGAGASGRDAGPWQQGQGGCPEEGRKGCQLEESEREEKGDGRPCHG